MNRKIKNSRNISGLSFLELILYIAMLVIFLTGAVQFAWDITYGRVKSGVQQEVNHNLRFPAKRIIHAVRNASAINSVSASDLCLASSDANYNPTRLYLNSGELRVAWGGGSVNCTAMTNDESLTSNKVTVTDLTFINLSSGSDSYNISFSISIESDSDRSEWDDSGTYSSSVELRSN